MSCVPGARDRLGISSLERNGVLETEAVVPSDWVAEAVLGGTGLSAPSMPC